MNTVQKAINDWIGAGGNIILITAGCRATVLFTDEAMTEQFKEAHPIIRDGRTTNAFLDTDIGGWVVGDLPTFAIID